VQGALLVRFSVLLALVLASFTTIAFADPDAPTDGGVPPPGTNAQPAEPTPPDQATTPPTETAPPPTTEDEHDKKKKKHKHDEDGEPAGGDIQNDIVDDEAEPEIASRGLRFRWLFQTRYTHVVPSVTDTMHDDPRVADGYSLFRTFMRATAKPTPWLHGKLLIDFAELARKTGAKSVKLAYAEINLHPRVTATVGLFKRTFSLLELLAISDYELADIGPADNLIKDAELGGRDIGAMVRVDPLEKKRWLNIYLSTLSGALTGANAHVDGLLAARVASEPVKHLIFGVDGVWRPKSQEVPAGFTPSVGKGKAISADVRYEAKKLHLRAEWMFGDRADFNHRGDDAMGNGGARTFMSVWAVAAMKFKLPDLALLPAVRVEWLDADREHGVGRRYYLSGALNLMDRHDQVRLLVDVSRSIVQSGSPLIGQPPGLLDQSSTIAVVQVQVKI